MSIAVLFDLEDEENLILENHCENTRYKGKPCKCLKGRIIQADNTCIECQSKELSKNGEYDRISKFNSVNGKLVVIDTRIQRYTCRACGTNFTPEVSFIDKKKRISNQILKQVSVDLTNPTSVKQVARYNHISHNTVQINLKEFKVYNVVNKEVLPKVLCVDEFRGVKSWNAKMNLIIVDAEKRTVKDILINRHKNNIISYFENYTDEAREQVQFFVSDFYGSYLDIALKIFPNAKIIIDRFHIKRLLSVDLKNKRIEVMKRFKKYHFSHRVLKRYRGLLFKSFKDISIEYRAFKYSYNKFHSEYDVLNYILSLDEGLEEMYWVYQDFIEAFDNKDEKTLREVIRREYTGISKDMQVTFNTYRKHEEYVINAILYPYSNGIVEGMNNKIKLLKRVGYGYRNFETFRLRVMIMFNLVQFMEDKKRKEKRIKEYHRKAS